MRPRVLHLTRDFPPRSNGGLSTAVGGLVSATHNTEHRVLSFDAYRPSSRGVATFCVDGAVGRVSGSGAVDEGLAWAIRGRPQVVHCHHALLWPVARQVVKAAGASSVATCHVIQAALDELRQLDTETASARAETEMMAEADRVTAPSHAACRLAVAHYPRCHLTLLPLGTVLPELGGGVRDSLLFVGRFADVTGFSSFIEVARRLRQEAPSLRVAVCGGLPDSRRTEDRWLAKARAALADGLTYRGWQTGAELTTEYQRAQVAVIPSTMETFCQVGAEALANACPVAGFATPALQELAAGCARLVPVGDIDALTDAATELVVDGDASRAMGQRGRQRMRDHYGWAGAARKAEALWLSLAAGR